jgi:hypothetical protein
VAASWRGGFQYPVAATVAIDAGGAVGARLSEGIQAADPLDLSSLRRRFIDPLVRTVALVLVEAEAYGRTTWRLDVTLPRQDFQLVGLTRQVHAFFASAELSTPDDQNEIQSLSRRWGREYARECGEAEWA